MGTAAAAAAAAGGSGAHSRTPLNLVSVSMWTQKGWGGWWLLRVAFDVVKFGTWSGGRGVMGE